MNKDTLRAVIDRKNKTFEEAALRTAAVLVDQIAYNLKVISEAQAKVDYLRKQLKELQVEELNPRVILGVEE